MPNSKKIKHSIVDKIIFFLLCVSSFVTLMWDLFKDFIPEKYWQLKFLIMFLGALSAFFGFLSFYWDRKFDTVTKDIITSQDKKITQLDEKVQLFLDGDFCFFQSFNDAIVSIFTKQKSYFKSAKIFAYSAKTIYIIFKQVI